jgi:integrase
MGAFEGACTKYRGGILKLTHKSCETAKPKAKPYKLSDGGGLYLEVMTSGSKLWRMKYRFHHKEKRLALGAFPTITLLEAREGRERAKKLLAQGIDPSNDKQNKKKEALRTAQNTFKGVALAWIETNTGRWSENYRMKVIKGLELHVFPYLGHRPIKDITPPELLSECLRRIEKRGSLDIAGRTKQICGQVFRHGIQTGYCEWNAAENLQGALKTKPTEHFRTIDSKQLPEFMKALERNEARLFERTRRAVWLSLYTFCRPVEIRKARWEDIDLEERLWTIPAAMMKMRRDHIVPLSPQALTILQAQREEVKVLHTQWVFPSQIKHKNPMSDGTVNKAIKNLGYGQDMVAHGFRALARTTIREKLRYDSEIIEKQLAHKTRNPLGEAYDRTQFLDERRKMMEDWANYIDSLASVGQVVKVKFG